MEKDDRLNGKPEQVMGSREPQRASRPAPGKVARTSKLSPSRGPAVQRKTVAAAPGGTAPKARSPWELTVDPWMDAAHRGVTALAERDQDPVQARRRMDTEDPAAVHRAAAAGVSETGSALPYLDQLQEAFGETYDLSQVRAHVGGHAATANEDLGAAAYATGNHIAFRSQPDLHTAAHEAAHVVQQRTGVTLQGGVGQAGDAYEQHADAVADAVVAGQSAQPLLRDIAGPASKDAVQSRHTDAVQRAELDASTPESSRAETSSPAAGSDAATGDESSETLVPRGGRDYIIARGDTLSAIAVRTYGRASYWREIMRANPREVHRNGNLIYVGHVLYLPVIEVPQSTAPTLPTAPTLHLDDLGHRDEEGPVCEAEIPDACVEVLGPPDMCLPRDYQAVARDLRALTETDRRRILQELRTRGEWESFLDALNDEDVAFVQSWLPPEEGQDGNYTLEERLEHAHNSDRGRAALAAVDAIAAADHNQPPRITERLRELLALGVALPQLEGNALASEGVLSVQSATRAAEALVAMPTREYLRVVMLLQLVGGESAWNQSFNVLESLAARRDEFLDTDATNDSLQVLEQFTDAIREMSDEEIVRQTNVTQVDPAHLGMTQRFTMSCNVTSALVVRAQADPIEALQIHQQGDLGIDALGGDVARQTEQGLENHRGNVAIARQPSTVQNDINAAITALAASAPADELAAVSDYMAGRNFDAAKYARGIAHVRTQIDRDGYPNDQELRLVRETAMGGQTPGITPQELQTEWNSTLDVDEVTGQTASVDWDNTLWSLYTADNNGDGAPDRLIPNPLTSAWTGPIQAMLRRAKPRLENGQDLNFNVYWHQGGGHTMTFTNVREQSGQTSYLVHDTWTGNSAWVLESDIVQARWPGITPGRGLLCALIG